MSMMAGNHHIQESFDEVGRLDASIQLYFLSRNRLCRESWQRVPPLAYLRYSCSSSSASEPTPAAEGPGRAASGAAFR
jgi:hypothetical protein